MLNSVFSFLRSRYRKIGRHCFCWSVRPTMLNSLLLLPLITRWKKKKFFWWFSRRVGFASLSECWSYVWELLDVYFHVPENGQLFGLDVSCFSQYVRWLLFAVRFPVCSVIIAVWAWCSFMRIDRLSRWFANVMRCLCLWLVGRCSWFGDNLSCMSQGKDGSHGAASACSHHVEWLE
jgi:hypothetical protein